MMPPESEYPSEWAAKAQRFQDLIERAFVDEQGLLRSAVVAKSLQPLDSHFFHIEDDFLCAPGLPAPAAVWSYENTNISQGFYLSALVREHQTTGSGFAAALAHRTFESIWHVYSLAPENEKGFLCKPYGRQLSRETHADQYFPVVFGLRDFLALASTDERTRLGEMIVQFADWWIRQDYRLTYFGVPIQLRGRSLLNLLPLFGFAYELSGDERYGSELERRLTEVNSALPLLTGNIRPDRIRSPFGRYCGWYLALDYLIKQQRLDPARGGELLGEYWRAALATVADDGMCYVDVGLDPETGQFYAPATGYTPAPLFEDRIHWGFVYWTGRLKTAYGTAGLARAGLVVNQFLPDIDCLANVCRALDGVTDERLTSYVDDVGTELDAKHRWLTRDVRSDAITLWLWAYWCWRSRV